MTAARLRRTLIPMEFKVVELEREPIDFDLQLPPGRVDLGDEAEQEGNLATSGRAEVLHEHRGPKDIVADIRLRGHFAAKFQVPCARCVEPVDDSAGVGLRPDLPADWGGRGARRNGR